MKKLLFLLTIMGLLFVSCEESDVQEPTNGTITDQPDNGDGTEDATIPTNEIWYTSIDGNVVEVNRGEMGVSDYRDAFDAKVISNTYDNGKGIITFDSDVKKMEGGIFYECGTLRSITIPDSVISVGNNTFYNCSNLISVVIPNSVITIKWQAFYGCSSLTNITIPDSVTEIAEAAFNYCYSLESIYCKPMTPPTVEYCSFPIEAAGSGRKIYVPVESVEAYKSAEGWSEYADDIVGYDFE